MMLGITSKRQCVLNLWNGFHPEIIKALWMAKLNPDILSWKKVVSVAHHFEIAKKGRSTQRA
jgi:hypothetical protein